MTSGRDGAFLPLREYAVIGDGRTLALATILAHVAYGTIVGGSISLSL